jgi:hypothetical protein
MARLIRDLIEIPERVHQSDFVLRLSEGIERPEETLHTYVVTDQLRDAFQQALDLVRRALESRTSMGAYLHGSFGSGKSHFMAVLHLLLQHNPEARSIPPLAPAVARHGWTEGRRFLLVPYHLIGSDSLEQAVLGRYVEYVRQIRPDAPLPAVYLAEPIFENADRLRAQMGDETFFAPLNQGRSSGGGWGKFGAGGWDAASYAEAVAAPPGDPRRLDLVSALVTHHFPAYRNLAARGGEAFVPLDRGLSVLSKHAHSLGYDGLVLFLDELVLWLASRVADLPFVAREGAKVAKLVEAETSERPVPIVSFIARQRDLRELVGDHLPGAEKLSFSDTLKWSEGRFEIIPLEDRNLPAIARARLLEPRDEDARREIDRAFEETRKVRQEVLSALLGREGNPETFRDVYPFSPALVQVLVAISSVLQRERTALRVMLQLLVEQRATLRLGDLVPLGDLFDVIAGGDEPFTEEMRIHFDRARRLYHQKLLPMLERSHNLTRDEARSLPWDDPRAATFRGDDRLVKSLLLAALTPEVEALRGMTPARLAALNHGSIRSPIPGGEGKLVLNRCRQWASNVGEIKIGEDPVNPTITVQLSGVDTETILERVRSEDNTGNRKAMIRRLLFEQLGLPAGNDLFLLHSFPWRGTARRVEVVFANVRELAYDSLRNRGEDWKVVIDFPFDPERYTARDDLAKLDNFRDDEPDTATFCWVPAFFTHESLRDLGTYVILDFLLTGERLNEHASHLSQVDRAQARALLENQRSQLKQRLLSCLEMAYGVATPQPSLVEAGLELAERFQSLDRRFRPQPPARANLREALAHLLDQILSYRFPRHPKFETRVQTRDLKRVLDVAVRAAHSPQGRVEVEKELRPVVRQIANPLELGEMHEAAFVLGDRWRHHLTRAAATAGGTGTVGDLRKSFEEPEPFGLTREVQDLLILVFAEQTNRSFFQYNSAVSAELGNLADELELREQKLPSDAAWSAARDRAARIFGIAAPGFVSATNVSLLGKALREEAAKLRGPGSELVEALRSWMETFGVDPDVAPRLRTARHVLALVEELAATEPERALEILEAAQIATSEEAMGNAGKRAAAVVLGLRSASVSVLTGMKEIRDERRPRAEAVLDRLREALSRDELAIGLVAEVERAVAEAVKILTKPAPVPPPPLAVPGWKVIERESRAGLDVGGAEELFETLRGRLRAQAERRLRLEWVLEEKESE